MNKDSMNYERIVESIDLYTTTGLHNPKADEKSKKKDFSIKKLGSTDTALQESYNNDYSGKLHKKRKRH